MGKYIIELKQGEIAYKTVDSKGTPMIQLLAPIPYTEPDMEQVRKEAYQAYQQGINDAREGKASCQFCEYEMCSDRDDPCRICACNYMNLFKPKKQEKEEDGLRQNIQTIVDQCGYTLDEIATVLEKMKEES